MVACTPGLPQMCALRICASDMTSPSSTQICPALLCELGTPSGHFQWSCAGEHAPCTAWVVRCLQQ